MGEVEGGGGEVAGLLGEAGVHLVLMLHLCVDVVERGAMLAEGWTPVLEVGGQHGSVGSGQGGEHLALLGVGWSQGQEGGGQVVGGRQIARGGQMVVHCIVMLPGQGGGVGGWKAGQGGTLV